MASMPVYRVQPVPGGNIRTLHRNLLLLLGVKLEPDYDSDDSIMDEDDSSSDESVIPGDARNKVYDRERLVQKSQPHSKESTHVELESNVDIFPRPEVQSNLTDSIVEPELVVENSTLDLENTGDNVIPEDISLPLQSAFYPYGSSFAGFPTSSEVCACFGEWL